MRKRLVLVLALLVLVTLLAGCELPEKLDQGWRELAFVPLGADQFREMLFPIIACLVPLAVLFAALAASRFKEAESGLWFGMLVGLAILPFIIPILTELTKSFFWPESFDLSAVMSRMGWTFPLPEGDLNPWTLSAAMVYTLTLVPILHSTWQLVLLFICILCLITTMVTRSTKPLSVAGGAVLGWLFFPVAFSSLTYVFEAVRPEGAIAGRILSTVMNFNLAYIVLLTFITMLLYVGLPLLALIAVPSHSFRELDETEDKKFDLSEVLAGLAGVGAAKTVDENGNIYSEDGSVMYTEPPEKAMLPPPYEDGEFREVNGLDPNGGSSDDPSGHGDGVKDEDYLNMDDKEDDAAEEPIDEFGMLDIPSDETSQEDHLEEGTTLSESDSLVDTDSADQVTADDELDLPYGDSPKSGEFDVDSDDELDLPDEGISKGDLQTSESHRSSEGIYVPSYKELSDKMGVEEDPEQSDKLSLDDLPEETSKPPSGFLNRLIEVANNSDESDLLSFPED